MKTYTRLFASLIALAVVFAFVPGAFAQDATAKLRVVHASPDAPAVDVYVNGAETLSDVPFFTASDYLDLPAGTYQIQVTPAGADISEAVIDASATLEAGKAYTVAATGLVDAITATVVEDDLSAPADGQAKVRVYHFSPDAPAVDVKLQGGDTLVSDLSFPNASDYLAVDAGSYDLAVTPAGADDVVIDLSGTTLNAGQIYSVFATNTLASITPELAATTPTADGSGDAPADSGSTAEAPATLPATATGDATPLGMLLIVAMLLIVTGGLLLHRRSVR